jgi:hypothetical protein
MHLHPASFDYCDPNWKPITAKIPVLKDTDPKELGYGRRDYQIRCYDKFHGKRRTIFIAPTGSGKSLVQVFNAAREIIESDYKQKQVFIVPQLNIGNGFSEYRHKKLRINGKIYGWEITVNCCFDNEQSVKKIRDFLLKKHPCKSYRANKVLGGCTAVVSYAALLAAWAAFSKKEQKLVIKNTSFRPDEVHHISGVEEGGVPANRLGEFCKFVLDNKGCLHLTTATFFRGDRQIILGNEYMDSFEVFRVPFLEHWKSTGLRELHQNYHCYKNSNDLLKQILTAVATESNEPPIIIVPSDGHKFFKHINKWKWVKRLVDGLGKIYGVDKVLDLVSPERQQQDKKRLTADVQDFSAIVTCIIGREGTDWPACSRVHNTVLDANALQPIQKLGRALRQNEGKTDVIMVNYIEHFSDWDADADTIRERLSDRFNAVIAASMLDDMFYPILMPTLPQGDDGIMHRKRVSLEDIYGSQWIELIEDMMRRVLAVPASERSAESVDEIIDEIIEEYEEDMLEDVDFEFIKFRLQKEILRRMNPTNPKLKLDGIIIDFIRNNGWDKVVREHIAPCSPFIGGAKTKDLEKLHKWLNNSDWMENIEQIKKIGIANVEKGSRLWHFLLKQRRDYKVAKVVV